MYASGAARFALATGDHATAEELYPQIVWCLEYCRRKTNAEGVVTSDDEGATWTRVPLFACNAPDCTGRRCDTRLNPGKFLNPFVQPLDWTPTTHDYAFRIATRNTIEFLHRKAGLAPMDAYSLASIAISFRVTQFVNQTRGVHALIPKSLFSAERRREITIV